jgi:hypothetical protein
MAVQPEAVGSVGEGKENHGKHGITVQVQHNQGSELELFKWGLSRRKDIASNDHADDGGKDVFDTEFHESIPTFFLMKSRWRCEALLVERFVLDLRLEEENSFVDASCPVDDFDDHVVNGDRGAAVPGDNGEVLLSLLSRERLGKGAFEKESGQPGAEGSMFSVE